MGPGLRDRAQVFERFYTGDATRGAGLGLAIARELAEHMDGTLRAESNGHGAAFTLRLPARHGPAGRVSARPVAGLAAAVAAATLSACSLGGDDDVGDSSPRDVSHHEGPGGRRAGRRGALDAEASLPAPLARCGHRHLDFGDSASALGSDGGESGQGSGFVLDGDGYVATNAHVVTEGKPPATDKAERVFVEFSDANRVQARVVGFDLNADVALLKLDPAGLKLTPLALGHSDDLTVGTPVAAIGSPFGERQSLSVGVISALDRSIESLTQFQIGDAIQTDAAINPGNSGGPLLSARGRVLGINSQIKSASGGGEGVGFAVPVDTVRRSLRELRRDGSVSYGYLGVTSQPLYPQLARKLGLPVSTGALVVDVQDGSPADDAGLGKGSDTVDFQGQTDIPSDGDVVVSVDGRKLTHRRPGRPDRAPPRGRQGPARGAARRQAPQRRGQAGQAPREAARGRLGACSSWYATSSLALRRQVLPSLGSHAARAHEDARTPRAATSRSPSTRRPRRCWSGSWPSGRPTWRSTPRTAAWWSPRAATPRAVLVVDPIDGTRPALAGLESCCVSVAAAPLDGEPTMGDVSVGCVVEIPSGQVFLAERERGLVESPPVVLSTNERIDRMFWTYGFRGRPARALTEVIAELLDALLGRRGRRSSWARRRST